MKVLNKLKKGFTIVELVIVIAVIAILAAVLVPTFANLINKANISADTQLVRNLNTILIGEETAGGKPTSMSEVLAIEEENGYKVENLQAKAKDYKLVWSSATNRFYKAKVDGSNVTYETYPDLGLPTQESYEMWTIDSAPSTIFSTYLYQATQTVFENVTTGIDVGNETVTSIKYERSGEAHSVEIRTNSSTTEIYVNAPNDNISFYGEGIIAAGSIFANQSAHIYGEFSGSIAQGRVVYHVLNSDKVIIAENTGVIVALSESALTSEYKVDIKYTTGVSHYFIQTTSDDGEKITQTKVEISESGATATETKDATENVIETPAAITESITIAQGTVDPADAIVGFKYFAGGTGTENDPFLIVDYDTFQHVSLMSWSYYAYESYYGDEHYKDWTYACQYADSQNHIKGAYYEVKDGIEVIDCSDWVPVFLDGNFDGNNVVLTNLDLGLFDTVENLKTDISIIKNFTVNVNISCSSGVGAVVYSAAGNITLENVDVHGSIIGSFWVTPFIEFGPGSSYSWQVTIKNCLSDALLVATSGSASGFIGHPYDDVSNGSTDGGSNIRIIDSAYTGNMSATGNNTLSENFKYFTINGNDNRITTYYSEEFIEKLGFNPEGTLYNVVNENVQYPIINNEDGSKTFFGGNYGKNVVDYYVNAGHQALLNTVAQATAPAKGEAFTINKVTGATKAVISLQIAPNDSNNYGAYLGTYMTEVMDITSITSTFTSETVKNFNITVNDGTTAMSGVTDDGLTFNVVGNQYGHNAHNGATVKIVQYDTNGNVLNITSIVIAERHLAE